MRYLTSSECIIVWQYPDWCFKDKTYEWCLNKSTFKSLSIILCTMLFRYVYVSFKLLSNLCLLSECPNFSVRYAVIKGNMHNEGTKRRVICNADTQYEHAYNSVCQNGSWSGVPNCRKGLNGMICYYLHGVNAVRVVLNNGLCKNKKLSLTRFVKMLFAC